MQKGQRLEFLPYRNKKEKDKNKKNEMNKKEYHEHISSHFRKDC